MRKVTETRFRPLGRPARAGEWTKSKNRTHCEFHVYDAGDVNGSYEAYERYEAVVEVEDPVPEWINRLYDDNDDVFTRQTAAELFRALVEERAKEVGERLTSGETPTRSGENSAAFFARIVTEEFTR